MSSRSNKSILRRKNKKEKYVYHRPQQFRIPSIKSWEKRPFRYPLQQDFSKSLVIVGNRNTGKTVFAAEHLKRPMLLQNMNGFTMPLENTFYWTDGLIWKNPDWRMFLRFVQARNAFMVGEGIIPSKFPRIFIFDTEYLQQLGIKPIQLVDMPAHVINTGSECMYEP